MKHVSIYECELEKIMFVRPVIFIPGIMGSKLINPATEDNAWEPDDEKSWGAAHAYKGPKNKRAALIGPPTRNEFDPNFLEVYFDVEEDTFEETEEDKESFGAYQNDLDRERYRRWSGLAQNYYGDFLRNLDGGYKLEEESKWVCERVYAHPYNWTASNKTSAEHLAETVDYAITDTQNWIDSKTNGVTCGGNQIYSLKALKPIIVTHSMGGLVARGYTQSDNRANADKIAGVLHIAMPTDGSPNTYANMLSGFNAGILTSWVLGADQEEVTATAGNMPGALELLPNHVYKDEAGRKAIQTPYTRGWLRISGRDGKTAASWPSTMPTDDHSHTGPQKRIPPNGDPYEQIYLNQEDWWRLIYRELLNPDNDDHDAAFAACRRSILNAKAFHIQINKHGKFHPNTRMLYSNSAAAEFRACEAVRWLLLKGKLIKRDYEAPPDAFVVSDNEGTIKFKICNYLIPKGLYSVTHAEFFLQRVTSPGDGTVHRGAIAFEKGPLLATLENGFDHTDAFNNDEVQNWIIVQLREMAEEEIAALSEKAKSD